MECCLECAYTYWLLDYDICLNSDECKILANAEAISALLISSSSASNLHSLPYKILSRTLNGLATSGRASGGRAETKI